MCISKLATGEHGLHLLIFCKFWLKNRIGTFKGQKGAEVNVKKKGGLAENLLIKIFLEGGSIKSLVKGVNHDV